jgi:hypothetical protein
MAQTKKQSMRLAGMLHASALFRRPWYDIDWEDVSDFTFFASVGFFMAAAVAYFVC